MFPKAVVLACHCGSTEIPVTVKSPLKACFCSCAACRQGLGFKCTLLAKIPGEAVKLHGEGASTDHIGKYPTETHHGSKYFCTKCGTNLLHVPEGSVMGSELELFLPALNVDNIESLIEVDDAELERVMEGLAKFGKPSGDVLRKKRDEIEGICACGGVEITLKRPPKDFETNGDLTLRNWVLRDNPPKFAGNVCFCDLCRRVPGAPFWSWLFIPTSLLTIQTKAFSDSDHGPCLAEYNSTPRVTRRFCRRCGSQLSFAVREEMWDICAGLFDPQVLVDEKWIGWHYEDKYGDLSDMDLDKYIHEWRGGVDACSYVGDGEKWFPRLVEAYKKACKKYEAK